MNMIEKVAMAIWEANHHHGRWEVITSWDDADSMREVEHARASARAAIEAMQEPTEAMCKAGEDSQDPYDGGISSTEAGLVFSAMISAALKED